MLRNICKYNFQLFNEEPMFASGAEHRFFLLNGFRKPEDIRVSTETDFKDTRKD